MFTTTTGNLRYVDFAQSKLIVEHLNNPATRQSVKDAVLAGLNRDCVDAASDAMDVHSILSIVRDEILAVPA